MSGLSAGSDIPAMPEKGEAPRTKLLFVCTGNTCRSPLAQAIATAEAKRRGWREVESRSAGTFALPGHPAASPGIAVAARRGLDLSRHRTAELGFAALTWADLTLGMSPEHVEAARHIHPAADVRLLAEFLPAEHPLHGRPVVDPIGGGAPEYEATCAVLEAAIRALFDRLAGELRRKDPSEASPPGESETPGEPDAPDETWEA